MYSIATNTIVGGKSPMVLGGEIQYYVNVGLINNTDVNKMTIDELLTESGVVDILSRKVKKVKKKLKSNEQISLNKNGYSIYIDINDPKKRNNKVKGINDLIVKLQLLFPDLQEFSKKDDKSNIENAIELENHIAIILTLLA